MAKDASTGARLERFVRARWTRRDGGIRRLASEAGIDKDTLYYCVRGHRLRREVWGFTWTPVGQPGTLRIEYLDIGGNVLASGEITVTD